MSNEIENRRRLFSRGDLFWFLLLPLIMGVGYFGFRYYQNKNADPNLRLVAKFSDNVSVELKAIAFRSAVGKPGSGWWKPNGLAFPEFKPDTSFFGATTTPAVECVVVFEINDTSKMQPEFRVRPKLKPRRKSATSWSSTMQDSFIFMTCPVDEGYFASNGFIVEMATHGTQSIGHLTPDKTSTDVSVAGMSLRLEVIASEDGTEWEIIMNGPPRATQFGMQNQIQCTLSRAGTPTVASIDRGTNYGSKHRNDEIWWAFPKSDWTDIEITFIDYDRIAEFDAVSVSPGVMTSPRVVETRSTNEQ
ncbi:MAG: hypothetical protein WKF77_21840 [Planctomycetaceae bacterium]